MTAVNPSSSQQNLGACDVAGPQRPSKLPSCAFKPRSVVRNRPNHLVPSQEGEVFTWFSRGQVILVPAWPGDGAGQGSFGRCQIKEVAAVLKRRLENFLTYCTHQITNAVAEGLNSKITAIKHMAAGYRNKENSTTAIYFFCGNLDLCPRSSPTVFPEEP